MEDFGRYRRAGVNIGIGTDVAPHNLIEEMRLAAIVARILAEDIKTTSTAEVFRAAHGRWRRRLSVATILAGWRQVRRRTSFSWT
jgi:cytosine/adenosine deaminase-related metal-dependent hydrolase